MRLSAASDSFDPPIALAKFFFSVQEKYSCSNCIQGKLGGSKDNPRNFADNRIKGSKITRTAIIIIGEAIDPKQYEFSRLYDKEFSHGYRKASVKPKKKRAA